MTTTIRVMVLQEQVKRLTAERDQVVMALKQLLEAEQALEINNDWGPALKYAHDTIAALEEKPWVTIC